MACSQDSPANQKIITLRGEETTQWNAVKVDRYLGAEVRFTVNSFRGVEIEIPTTMKGNVIKCPILENIGLSQDILGNKAPRFPFTRQASRPVELQGIGIELA